MTVLALNGSRFRNGVSQLHGRVSRNMWHWLWPNRPADEAPIEAITNGVHTGTWLAPGTARVLYPLSWPRLVLQLDDPDTWKSILKAPDEELWEIHRQLKHSLLLRPRKNGRLVQAHRMPRQVWPPARPAMR